MITCRRYYVLGRVQGVAFRATTCRQALQLGLTGWVRNLPDGRVEVLACGEPMVLQSFEDWLWKGPSEARVQSVTREEASAEAFNGFEIR